MCHPWLALTCRLRPRGRGRRSRGPGLCPHQLAKLAVTGSPETPPGPLLCSRGLGAPGSLVMVGALGKGWARHQTAWLPGTWALCDPRLVA